jgi:carboxyl-terminal processing protease
MKKILCGVLLTLVLLPAFAQTNQLKEKAIILKRQVQRNHYNPKPVNDSFSSEMFSKILRELDPQQDIFTADDYVTLSTFRYKLDDELNGLDWKFVDVISGLFKQRLQKADTLVQSILQKPLDVTADDKITFSRDKSFHFASSPAELRSRWTKWFRFSMLNKLYDLYDSDSVKADLKTLLAKNESSLRNKMKKSTTKNIQNILDPAAYDNFIRDSYLNAIATTFDPHTMFFSPQEKENFQSELSTENYSFGFDIDETKDGKVIITQLIPGGPAWKTGEVHANDELLQIQWEGQPAIDISTISYEEADELLNQSNHGTITLKIRKTSGVVYSVTLEKEKIETQENLVKGYVLNGEKKIGYISLPGFYTIWEDERGSGCSSDMAKEIIRLKKENIEGLILDVRFNGGGSLEEALQLSGIFIDEGALTGTKDRTGKMVFLKDPNRGTVWDGPLILMVNGQSASASELLAAALQDYNRAVIVGSPTYGKATMQQIFPLDTMTRNPSAKSANGYVKITTGKLYRVSGLTAQLKGVSPDIRLPDAFNAVHYGERFNPDALPSDSGKRNAYYKPLPDLPIDQLRQLSNQRINNNKNFAAIKESIRVQGQYMDATEREVPLKLESFQKWADQNKKNRAAGEEKESAASKLFVSQNYKDETQPVLTSSYTKAINDITLKNIQRDIYIEEAFQIVIDLIKTQPKN